MLSKLVLLLSLCSGALAKGEDDLVTNLPGLIFNVTFNTYSGYLNAGGGDTNDWQMHYLYAFFLLELEEHIYLKQANFSS